MRHSRVALSVFILEKNKAAFLQVPLPFTSPTAEVKGYVEPHRLLAEFNFAEMASQNLPRRIDISHSEFVDIYKVRDAAN